MKNNILLIGAGGHGLVLAEIAKLIGYKNIYFLDDEYDKDYPYEIIGGIDDFFLYKDDYDFFVSIGSNDIRKAITAKIYSNNCKLVNLIHPSAIISDSVQLSEGIAIMPNTVINSKSKIGQGAIINTASSIDHETIIGNFVHISPGCHLAGQVLIEDMCWLGIGCNVINGIRICEKCIIGAGSTIIREIQKSGTYAGTPVRRIEKNESINDSNCPINDRSI